MTKETVQPQKKRGPKPTGKGTPVQVRIQPEQLEKLDAWRSRQQPEPSRPEAVRRLLEIAIEQNG